MDTPKTMRSAYQILTVKSDEKRQLTRNGRLSSNCTLINPVSPNTFIYRNVLCFYSRSSQFETRPRNLIFWQVIMVSLCSSGKFRGTATLTPRPLPSKSFTGRLSSCQSAAHPEILTASRNKTTHKRNGI